MLGDLLGEEQGRITAQRVLPSENGLPPTVESSFQASGTLLGVTISDMGTYTGELRPDGTLYGRGTGIIMSPDGAMASWQGTGVGTFTATGSIAWRGSIVYLTDSPAFAGLRGIAGLFEWETDQSGKAGGKLWAWR